MSFRLREPNMNSVRLYSNGTAVISREYRFDGMEPLHISIPVRKADLDDVISSLAVFGDVAVTEPPTYTPTNAEKSVLKLDPSSALRDLATKLAGASVEVEAGSVYKGKLLGLQPNRREFERTFLEQYRLVILTEKGVQQVDETAVTALRFQDPVVQTEIEKSLRSSLGKVNPESSKVEMTLRPNPGSDGATVTYATPVAAWKIRYHLWLTTEGADLDGQAVVDNDTDDDWDNTLITVITGEPITFSTDLAEIRRPARSRVNVVADRTTGAVIAEPEMPDVDAMLAPPEDMLRTRGGDPASVGQARLLARPAPPVMYGRAERGRAEHSEAEARESGDFSIFTSPAPVNVGAGRSAIIPLFRAAVGEVRAILLYKERDDPQRPFRAVRFRNQAAHALGRGVCEVYVNGDFQGKCLMEATKSGEDALLVYAKETGVRVFKKVHQPETRRMAIKISEGTVVNELLHRQRTSYRVRNSHPETFTLEIEHPRTWTDSDLKISLSAGVHEEAEIPSGRRIRVTLPAGESLEVRVVEEQVDETQFSLSVAWLVGNVIGLKVSPARAKGVQACIELQKKIDGLEAEIREQTEKSKTLAEEQGRLMKLIPNGHAEQAHAWRTDLADAETELREVKRSVLPKLRGQLKEAKETLYDALARLQYNWTDLPEGKGREDQPAGTEQ